MNDILSINLLLYIVLDVFIKQDKVDVMCKNIRIFNIVS